ncbi:unnamed protein product [Mesocestoides corti]|uniref:Uncharacterized protein n=1 Tax=Mesocestoides corti TaxID=53468 RepID=A0A0R3U8G4_MESCO|nr:unnamed protein product [Mesocestoides corti]
MELAGGCAVANLAVVDSGLRNLVNPLNNGHSPSLANHRVCVLFGTLETGHTGVRAPGNNRRMQQSTPTCPTSRCNFTLEALSSWRWWWCSGLAAANTTSSTRPWAFYEVLEKPNDKSPF